MVKVRGSLVDGRHLYIFGLTRENIDRLMAGKPIFVDTQKATTEGGLATQGGPGLVIIAGETAGDVMKDIGEFMKHTTVPGEPIEGEFDGG